MNPVRLLQICLLHAALLLYAEAIEVDGCRTANCLTASSSSSTRQTENYLATPTAAPVQPIAGHPKSIRNNTKLQANHQSNVKSAATSNVNNVHNDLNNNVSSNANNNVNLTSDGQLRSPSNVDLNKRANEDSVEPKSKLGEKFGKKALSSKHQANEKKIGGDHLGFKVKAKSLHQPNGLLNQRQLAADHPSGELASRLSGEQSSQPSDQPLNEQQNAAKSVQQVLRASPANDDQQSDDAKESPKIVTKKALSDKEKEGKKKSRARRAPRGGRISGKSGGSGNQRRQGPAKDGESPDDDSGSMTAKPFFPLAILSILFLSFV